MERRFLCDALYQELGQRDPPRFPVNVAPNAGGVALDAPFAVSSLSARPASRLGSS